MATLTVYSDAADGYLRANSTSYATARAGPGSPIQNPIVVGQAFIPGGKEPDSYSVYEGFISFDTSALGAGATISAAVLTMTANIDYAVTDFTINARAHDWGATLAGGDWVAGASLSGKTLLCHRYTSPWATGTAYDFVDDALPANVSKTATTYMVLSSSATEAGTLPGQDYVSIFASEWTGTTYDPKLTITYTPGATGRVYSQVI